MARQTLQKYTFCVSGECEQGRELMETTRVCDLCNKPKLPEDYGTDRSRPGGKARYCKICVAARQRENYRRRTLQQQEQTPAQKKPSVERQTNTMTITVDFRRVPAVFEALNTMAAQEFRSLENQVLYLLVRGTGCIRGYQNE